MILSTILSRDLLIDGYKFYSRGDARAHDALRIIIDRNDMEAAVLGCLEEAKRQKEPDKQNLCTQAACFGKKFHPGIAIEEYQSTCRLLRLENICLSKGIDPELELEQVIDQFLQRKDFDMALWIVRWLKASGEERVLSAWCEYMIEKRHIRDEQVASKIQEVLGPRPIISYADIATKATDFNRIPLAIKLIENEAQSSKQIPLLLSLRKYDLVLAQALSTYDSNLIYMSIFKLKESLPSEIQFFELLKKHKLAFRYYCNFLAISDTQKLIMISYSESHKDELSLYLMDNKLEQALAVSKRTKQDFVSNHIEIHLRLTKFQQGLKQLAAPPLAGQQACWVGLSVCDTITNLVALGQPGKARDCQKKFEVSDKKYRTLEQIAMNVLPKMSVPVIN